jgi:hypothetical protein
VKGSDSAIGYVAEIVGANVGERTVRLRSPTTEEILAWRARLTTKYRDELEEELTWDEGSTFEVSQDVGASADVMFHYVAAVFDQRGKSELSNLIDVDKLTPRELDAAFTESARRGFGGCFPHPNRCGSSYAFRREER